jgi:uncharacterized membrane protein YjfL (UPF0719 family)
LVELGLSLILGVLVAYVSFRLFARMTRDLDEVEELERNNVAVGMLLGSMLVGVAVIVRKSLYPSISCLKTALYQGLDLTRCLQTVGLSLLYVLLSFLIAVGCIGLSTRLFLRLTHDLNEMAEIRKNNIAVAITLGSVIIVVSLFISQGVQNVLSSIIPYPAVESIQIMGGR